MENRVRGWKEGTKFNSPEKAYLDMIHTLIESGGNSVQMDLWATHLEIQETSNLLGQTIIIRSMNGNETTITPDMPSRKGSPIVLRYKNLGPSRGSFNEGVCHYEPDIIATEAMKEQQQIDDLEAEVEADTLPNQNIQGVTRIPLVTGAKSKSHCFFQAIMDADQFTYPEGTVESTAHDLQNRVLSYVFTKHTRTSNNVGPLYKRFGKRVPRYSTPKINTHKRIINKYVGLFKRFDSVTDLEIQATADIKEHPIIIYTTTDNTQTGYITETQTFVPPMIRGSPIVVHKKKWNKCTHTLDKERTQHWSLYATVYFMLQGNTGYQPRSLLNLYDDVKSETIESVRHDPEKHRSTLQEFYGKKKRGAVNPHTTVIDRYLPRYTKNSIPKKINPLELQALATVVRRPITILGPQRKPLMRSFPTDGTSGNPLVILFSGNRYRPHTGSTNKAGSFSFPVKDSREFNRHPFASFQTPHKEEPDTGSINKAGSFSFPVKDSREFKRHPFSSFQAPQTFTVGRMEAVLENRRVQEQTVNTLEDMLDRASTSTRITNNEVDQLNSLRDSLDTVQTRIQTMNTPQQERQVDVDVDRISRDVIAHMREHHPEILKQSVKKSPGVWKYLSKHVGKPLLQKTGRVVEQSSLADAGMFVVFVTMAGILSSSYSWWARMIRV